MPALRVLLRANAVSLRYYLDRIDTRTRPIVPRHLLSLLRRGFRRRILRGQRAPLAKDPPAHGGGGEPCEEAADGRQAEAHDDRGAAAAQDFGDARSAAGGGVCGVAASKAPARAAGAAAAASQAPATAAGASAEREAEQLATADQPPPLVTM